MLCFSISVIETGFGMGCMYGVGGGGGGYGMYIGIMALMGSGVAAYRCSRSAFFLFLASIISSI